MVSNVPLALFLMARADAEKLDTVRRRPHAWERGEKNLGISTSKLPTSGNTQNYMVVRAVAGVRGSILVTLDMRGASTLSRLMIWVSPCFLRPVRKRLGVSLITDRPVESVLVSQHRAHRSQPERAAQ